MESNKAAPRKKKHVLIVDDNLELAQTYKLLLEAHNYTASTANNGVLALKHILHKEVDAVVCDLRMPQLEGDMFYITAERVKPDLCQRFVFITGLADDPKYQSFASKVESPVLHKPVTIETLVAALEKVLAPPM
jgi:two-component system sensor kinase